MRLGYVLIKLIDVILIIVLVSIYLFTCWVLVFGASFSWMQYYSVNVVKPMGWVGLPVVLILGMVILFRDKLAEVSISASGIQAKMQEVRNKQKELKQLGLVLMEGLVRVSNNSLRWAGWTPREMGKVKSTVDRLADELGLSNNELKIVWSSKTRWELIDSAVELFKQIEKTSEQGEDTKRALRERFDNEWKEKDVLHIATFKEILRELNPHWHDSANFRDAFQEYEVQYDTSPFVQG